MCEKAISLGVISSGVIEGMLFAVRLGGGKSLNLSDFFDAELSLDVFLLSLFEDFNLAMKWSLAIDASISLNHQKP